jgi:flagellin-like protein
MKAMLGRRGLSYVVGVLIVLAVTLAAVVAFSQILGFQAGVLTSLQALDVRRLGESLVPIEGIRLAGDIIVYNNGLIPTCFLEVRVVGTTIGYSVTNCNPVTMDVVPPRQYGVVNLYDVGIGPGPPISAGEYVVIARTLHNKIVTFRVVFR